MIGKVPHWGISIPLLGMLLAGCSTTQVGYDGPCPARPELVGIDAELQADIPAHTLEIITDNQLKLKQHILDLEVLSGCSR